MVVLQKLISGIFRRRMVKLWQIKSFSSQAVWPDLAKFHCFGKYLKIFGSIFKVYLVEGKVFYLLWHNLCCYWSYFLCCKWPNIEKNNLAIWSHWSQGRICKYVICLTWTNVKAFHIGWTGFNEKFLTILICFRMQKFGFIFFIFVQICHEQCEQIARLFVQYLAIYRNKHLPNTIHNLVK